VRKEDKTIREFIIPAQEKLPLDILTISSIKMKWSDKPKDTKINIDLQRGDHLQIIGPNGIGKSTLLESLAETFEDNKESNNSNHSIAPDVKVGYYRQDFSNLDFNKTTYETLSNALGNSNQQEIRSTASGFLITEEFINTKIGNLSEGQKGLVAFTELVLMRPGLLILDEPTNHINFRHLPVIANALDKYEGAMIIVSHVPDFISQIRIDKTLDLEKAFSGK
ncbi:MAG: ATP-binding cassette domain-containing protein, partial [Candidatus Paceibacterota bacterium]